MDILWKPHTFAAMKAITTTYAILACYALSFAQSIPKDQSTDWKSVNHTIQIDQKNVVNVKSLGADATGQESCDKYVQLALENSRQTGAIIYFPKGTYYLTQTINLTSNQILAGDGSEQTTLKFNLNGSGHLIQANGQTFAQWTPITEDAYPGENTVSSNNEFLNDGDLVHIRLFDSLKTSSSWAKGSIGQLSTIVNDDGSRFQISDELRIRISKDDRAELIKVIPVENIGIANLKIIRMDATAGQTSNIHFRYVKNALVSGVYSDSCNFSHINNTYSYGNRIENSYFTNGFSYGGGGKAYGVVLSFTSSNCIVENNIFNHLRHSILFQAGPNGNIVAYNYSKNAYWTGVFSPSDFAGDIVLHGNYPFKNLVEGNVLQNLVIDNSHGINGPGNVFLRNRVQNAGIFMNCKPASDQQIFIGNEITGTGTSSNGFVPFPKGLYQLCDRDHYEYGNNKNGTMIPSEVTSMITSLYLSTQPSFIESSTFPFIGYPAEYNKITNDAHMRDKKNIFTIPYEFDVDLGPKFKTVQVEKDEIGVLLKWSMNILEECEKFEILRSETGNEYTRVGGMNYVPSKGLESLNFRDYNYNHKAASLFYKVRYVDFYGSTIDSKPVRVVLDHNRLAIAELTKRNESFIGEVTWYSLSGKKLITTTSDQQPQFLPNGIYVKVKRKGSLVSTEKVGIVK